MFESFFLFFTGIYALIGIAVILSIIYTASVEGDEYGWAIGTTIIAGVIYHKWLFALQDHWKAVLLLVILYGLVGALWSVYRWFKYCKKKVEDNPYDKRPSYMQDKPAEQYYHELLMFRSYKSRLIGWIVFWPWSLIWNIAGDFFTGIYDALKGVYERVAKAVIQRAIKNNP